MKIPEHIMRKIADELEPGSSLIIEADAEGVIRMYKKPLWDGEISIPPVCVGPLAEALEVSVLTLNHRRINIAHVSIDPEAWVVGIKVAHDKPA